uniref:PH domain-containing protein n=2 Tax=Lepeophtheirus salmonis TaxID=72036 RepID=A0A0K2UVV5_LEPSM
MKVPRSGSGNGVQRLFVLFNDTLMYCKVKGNYQYLKLPKPNSIECCCLLPLKHAKIDTLVGNGIFKVTCKKEELILYSLDGPSECESWVDALKKAVSQLAKDASTLRKESSKREPMRRPEILKLRRESLSLILLMRKNKESESSPLQKEHIESPKSISTPSTSTPSKKRPATSTPTSSTPSKKKKKDFEFISPPPPMDVRRSKRVLLRKSLKSLSFSRKDSNKAKHQEENPVFQSPSIYKNEKEEDVMKSYLAEKICPLTPSQRPTSVAHLAKSDNESFNICPIEKENEEMLQSEETSISDEDCGQVVTKKETSFSSLVSGCSIM